MVHCITSGAIVAIFTFLAGSNTFCSYKIASCGCMLAISTKTCPRLPTSYLFLKHRKSLLLNSHQPTDCSFTVSTHTFLVHIKCQMQLVFVRFVWTTGRVAAVCAVVKGDPNKLNLMQVPLKGDCKRIKALQHNAFFGEVGSNRHDKKVQHLNYYLFKEINLYCKRGLSKSVCKIVNDI